MKLVVSGGGTGGHFFPALAVLKEASNRGMKTLYVGTLRGIEYKLKDSIPSERVFLEVLPFSGKSPLAKIKALISYLRASSQLVSKIDGDSRVLSFGGYGGVPSVLAAIRRGVPLFIHEQNSVPGSANRLLSNFSKKVFITFEYSRKFFKGKEVVRTGLPVRDSVINSKIEKGLAKSAFGVKEKEPLFLFFGGSQGARFINNLALEFATKTGSQVILISGEKEYDVVAEKAKDMENLHLYPFRSDMGLVYSACDIAVCRAGASTLSELSLFGIPAVLIPYPYAHGNHQFYNAKEIEELGGAITLKQSDVNISTLISSIDNIIVRYREMREAISTFANPQAASEIIEGVS